MRDVMRAALERRPCFMMLEVRYCNSGSSAGGMLSITGKSALEVEATGDVRCEAKTA